LSVTCADTSTAANLLVVRAEEALYTAQQDGHNCIRSYEEATGTRLRVSMITADASGASWHEVSGARRIG
jgi:hypothetical protein